MRCLSALIAVALLAGCNPSTPNRVAVFTPIAGAVAISLKIPTEPDTRAEFALAGKPLPPDTTPADGYSVVIDTLEFANGLHTLHVRIADAQGQTRRELDHSILIKN